MKRAYPDGEVVFRPSFTRASLPLAVVAVAVPLLVAGLVLGGVLAAGWLGTAIAGAFLLFCTSFLQPLLMSVRVRPGEIWGPAPGGFGIHTLRLERLDLKRTYLDEAVQSVFLVDQLGSKLDLTPLHLPWEEILEAVEIFGLDPVAIAREP